MSRWTEKCPTCKGKGEIIVDNWLTEGRTEEELAREKEEALADIVEVVRCKDCKYYQNDTVFGQGWCNGKSVKKDDYCSYGERSENGT